MFKVKTKGTRITSKRYFGVFIVNFERISQLFYSVLIVNFKHVNIYRIIWVSLLF